MLKLKILAYKKNAFIFYNKIKQFEYMRYKLKNLQELSYCIKYYIVLYMHYIMKSYTATKTFLHNTVLMMSVTLTYI